MHVSTLILTLNEELNLPRCLSSVAWCNDIVVLDSYSSDRTAQIAKDSKVRFAQRPFDDYASQRNFGLNQIKYQNPWVLMVDADEVVSKALADEINQSVTMAKNDITLYYMRRKDFFFGKWIKHSSGYPTWFGRLARIGKVVVKRTINEEYFTHGEKGFLKEHLFHYPCDNGIHRWIEKHNYYSTMEAEIMEYEKAKALRWIELVNKDPVARRKTIKAFVYRLPLRPLLIFFALFFMRGGFLDGRSGLTFCLLKTYYEFIINCKAREIRIRKNGKPDKHG
jgi:glycosyltransferase involved in cell wall biosynthesis